MYLNALESQRISDTDSLSLIYLPNQARATVQSYGIFILLCTSHLFPRPPPPTPPRDIAGEFANK